MMTDFKKISDKEIILERYKRIKGDDEISQFKNYCYRAALRPVFNTFDKINTDEVNIRGYQPHDWEKVEAERDSLGLFFRAITPCQKQQTFV